MAKRKIYTDEFMSDACRLVADGMSIVKAAKKVKIHHTMLRKWVNKSKGRSPAAVKPSSLANELDAKIQELQDKVITLEMARDILR